MGSPRTRTGLCIRIKIPFTKIRCWKSKLVTIDSVYWMHPERVVSTFVCAKHCGTFLNTKQMFKHHHLVVDISIQTTKHDTTKCVNQCLMINSHVISLLPYCSVAPVFFRPRLLHSEPATICAHAYIDTQTNTHTYLISTMNSGIPVPTKTFDSPIL